MQQYVRGRSIDAQERTTAADLHAFLEWQEECGGLLGKVEFLYITVGVVPKPRYATRLASEEVDVLAKCEDSPWYIEVLLDFGPDDEDEEEEQADEREDQEKTQVSPTATPDPPAEPAESNESTDADKKRCGLCDTLASF